MYKEIEKFKTNIKHRTEFEGHFTLVQNEYKANLGVLINDFIEHKNKPFWKRKFYHDHLTELYLKFFESIDIITII